MSRIPLPAVDRTLLPRGLREWVGRRLSGPPAGPARRHWRAAIFQLDRLGDFVLALGAIRLLLAAWGEENCLLVISVAAEPLAAREFPRCQRLVLPTVAASLTRDLIPFWWRLRPAFRGEHCELAVCLSHHRDVYKATALSWIAASSVAKLEPADYPDEPPGGSCLELEAHRRLVARVLGRPVSEEEIRPALADSSARDGDALLVCPFASEEVRQLPRELLLATVTAWRKRSPSAPIVLNSHRGDEPRLQALAGIMAQQRLGPVRTAPTADFGAFLGVLAQAGAVLTVESGPSHLATALDKRTVVLLGGGTFGLCAPWRRSTRQVLLSHDVPCYGCGWRCDQPRVLCLADIAPEAVAAALPAL